MVSPSPHSEGQEQNCPVCLDLAVIGAGPCALALLSRLSSEAPDGSAEYFFGFDTEVRPQAKMEDIYAMAGRTGEDDPFHGRVRVFDNTSGGWIGRWRQLFTTLSIPHLRSPHVAHPSPAHSFAVLAHADAIGLHEDGFKDFPHLRNFYGCHRAPSSDLFESFCARLSRIHGLDALIEHATVVSVEPGWALEEESNRQNQQRRVSKFVLHVQRGGAGGGGELFTVEARAVVVATGTAASPRVPDWMRGLREGAHEGDQAFSPHSLRHAWELHHDLLPQGSTPAPAPLTAFERVLVIGGGLTSVQLCSLAAYAGCASVTLAARRRLSIQQFDSGSAWMDNKLRPALLRRFFKGDTKSRWETIRHARGVATVPPEALASLKHRSITLRESTEVEGAPVWDSASKAWRVVLRDTTTGRASEEVYERIWCATGSHFAMNDHPILSAFAEKCPPRAMAGGLPRLTPWMAWAEGCEMYVLGAAAALAIGPDAFNLMGARVGAARAAHVLHPLANRSHHHQDFDEVTRAMDARKHELSRLKFNYDSGSGEIKGIGLRASTQCCVTRCGRGRQTV